MKKISLVIITTLFTLSLFWFSCQKKNATPTQNNQTSKKGSSQIQSLVNGVTPIYQDPLFHAMVRNEAKLINGISLANRKEIAENNKLDQILSTAINGQLPENSKLELSTTLGFQNVNQYEEFIMQQNNLIAQLNEKYQVASFTEAEKQQVIMLYDPYFFGDGLEGGRANVDCSGQYNNCIVGVTAEAVLMHIGCGAADLTIVLGIACHAAVTAWQIAQSNSCGYAYDACKKGNGMIYPGPNDIMKYSIPYTEFLGIE